MSTIETQSKPKPVEQWRNFGVPFSDAESNWPKPLMKRMRRDGRKVVMGHLRGWQRVRFGLAYLREWRRMKRVDLSAFRARGLTNESFIAQQIEFVALFATLAKLFDEARAVQILNEVMDKTATEAMLLCLPERADIESQDDRLGALHDYLAPGVEASRTSGSLEAEMSRDTDGAVRMDVTWCVWLELARALGAPAACASNCYADDLVYPEFFKAVGIRYVRTQTLARGGTHCDFRFERLEGEGEA